MLDEMHGKGGQSLLARQVRGDPLPPDRPPDQRGRHHRPHLPVARLPEPPLVAPRPAQRRPGGRPVPPPGLPRPQDSALAEPALLPEGAAALGRGLDAGRCRDHLGEPADDRLHRGEVWFRPLGQRLRGRRAAAATPPTSLIRNIRVGLLQAATSTGRPTLRPAPPGLRRPGARPHQGPSARGAIPRPATTPGGHPPFGPTDRPAPGALRRRDRLRATSSPS